MLNHLDDPNHHQFPDGFADDVRGRARVLQRRRRLAACAMVTVVVVVVGSAGLYARSLSRIDDVDRLTVAGTGEPATDDARTVLVVGVDSNADELARTDTILVVRVDGDRASVLSIPRDLAVHVPGTTETARINSVGATHGYGMLLEVIRTELAIDIDNFVRVDFEGFARLVDLVGGVDVHASSPVRDNSSGLAIDHAGCHRLDGRQALALARSRHLQVLTGDRWHADPTGDLGRIDRQPVLLTSGLEAITRTRPDPLTADRLAGWLERHAAVDDTLGNSQLIDLLRTVMDVDPDKLEVSTIPVEPYTLPGGAAVLRATEGTADAVAGWRDGGRAPRTSDGPLSLCDGHNSIEADEERLVGEKAPPLHGRTLRGDDFDLAAHEGQHVVITFTATWCTPCLQDLPALRDFADQHRDVVLVSIAIADTREQVLRAFQDVGVDWTVLEDLDGAISEDFGVHGVPEYLVVGPDGRVTNEFVGRVDTEALGAATE